MSLHYVLILLEMESVLALAVLYLLMPDTRTKPDHKRVVTFLAVRYTYQSFSQEL